MRRNYIFIQLADMEELAIRLCWEQVGKDELVAIWRKPRSNACLRSRSPDARPALCDAATVDPDKTWYVCSGACFSHEVVSVQIY